MRNVMMVFLGGGLGSVLRYLTVVGMLRVTGRTAFPFGVLVANVLGSFVLGFLFALPAMKSKDSATWMFLATGVMGGYTTFSTLANDSWVLFGNHHSWLALLNAVGSITLGFMAAGLGWAAARWLAGGP